MTLTLMVMRGLPASGKTKYATEMTRTPGSPWTRVSRDDYRGMLFGATGTQHAEWCLAFQGYGCHEDCVDLYQAHFSAPDFHKRELAVSAAQEGAVRALLETGRSVIVDDTNLRVRYMRKWVEIANDCGAEFLINDMTDVSVETCVARDMARGSKVGAEVIYDMAARLRNMQTTAEFLDEMRAAPAAGRYVPDKTKPDAYIVDIDGTVALMNGRSPYDYHRVYEDLPNEPIIDTVLRLCGIGENYDATVLFVSGRDGSCRDDTLNWLSDNVLHHSHFDIGNAVLYMREAGDKRDDALIKREIFERDIAPNYHVLGVFDDRNRVVRMWRSLGLTCFQVAPGAF